MRAIVCRELGSLEDLAVEDLDPLVPGAGQVVIDRRAAGVNHVDGLLCQGRYQIKPPTPFVPGGEVAGEVAAVGEGVTGVDVGDRVSTARFTLTRRTQVTPGEWVLVVGAGGGVGLAMIDVAIALGARVIAAASTAEKLSATAGCTRRFRPSDRSRMPGASWAS